MGSYLMHIGITEKVRRKLKLSTKFIYGSILPDLVKMETGDREGTHFLKTIEDKDGVKRLPVIDDAIAMLSSDIDKEVRLGYIAHLIEDLLWFEKYIPSFATKLEEGKKQYLADNSVHSAEEFSKDIYEDYSKINSYMVKRCELDYEKIKEQLKEIMTDKEYEFLEKNDIMRDVNEIDTTKVIPKDKLNEYIEEAEEKVEVVIKELLGE
ncbi:MAG: hypothetical protein IKK84_05790 [Clostridia bacterium]|nr:hypothetical protein [Clostridia bacterium]